MAGASGKRDLMTTLVVVLLLTLVGAGVGFAVGILLKETHETEAAAPAPEVAAEKAAGTVQGESAAEETHEAAAGEEPEQDEEEVSAAEVKVIPFPAVLTTLSEPKGKWIRLEGSILAAAEMETAPELLAEQSGEQILTFLRGVRLDQIESASGFLGFRDDLTETLRTLSNGQVRGILIHGLVVE